MRNLINRILSIVVWTCFGAGLGWGVVAAYTLVFNSGITFSFTPAHMQEGMIVGGIIGFLIGAFRRF